MENEVKEALKKILEQNVVTNDFRDKAREDYRQML